MRIQEFTGKTTQEAIDAGLAALGVTIADVHVDVLQEGAKGLFGLFGSKPARVRITVMEDEKDDDQGLSDLLGSFSLSDPNAKKKPERPAPRADKPAPKPGKPEPKPAPNKADKPAPKPGKPEPKPEPKADKPAPKPEPKADKPAPAAETRPERAPKPEKPARPPRPPKPPRAEKAPLPKPEEPALPEEAEDAAPKEYAPMIPAEPFTPTEPPVIHPEDTPAGRAQRFLTEVTALMGVKVDVYVDDSRENALSIHMIGDTLGILIGRRGETLDALQYLTSLQVNKGREGYIRVTLDTENYRAKREDSLRRLAQRMANRAVKTGRKVVLEPMNPYERRVLHTALQNSPAVTTHSEGEEPNRRVVIMLKNPPERAAQEAAPEAAPEGAKSASRGRGRRRGRRGSRRSGAPAADVNAPAQSESEAPQGEREEQE